MNQNYFYHRPNRMLLHGIPKSVMERARRIFWYSMGSWLDGMEFRAMTVADTIMRFPAPVSEGGGRRAQQMNYEYCVQTIAGLMKKYAPEILNEQEDGYGNG